MKSETPLGQQKAKDVVFRMLKLRLHSEYEIRKRLIKKQFESELIDKTIQYFKDIDFIDDRKFAKQWIVARLHKPFGASRIQFELKTKGIDEEILKEELAFATKDYPEIETVTALARKRASVYDRIPQEKMKQRVYGYLVRRGFSSYAISKAMREI